MLTKSLWLIIQTSYLLAKTHTNDAKTISQSPSSVHKSDFIDMPKLTGTPLGFDVKPLTYGNIDVVYFMASWCPSCLERLTLVMAWEKKLQKPYVRFIYAFAHNTVPEARALVQTYGLKNALVLDREAIAAYHNPKLPSIYLSDRYGSLLARKEECTQTDFKELEALVHDLISLSSRS
jgi:thiol-disulfide isomerase/thioredoxin